MKNQRNDEIVLLIYLNNTRKLTKTDIDNIEVKSQLQHQIQIQENDSGWRFDKKDSMKTKFYKTGEVNGSSDVKIRLRSNAILKIKNDDKLRFFLVSFSLFTSL